ncbi:LacI family DNA-binding transcriptional regulator [Nonomuraea sp. SYSU D8015]|uniref:LacI family DNA-binding transcriptional regulator n=1 Tax=Nonomuraea sp. SYSU D8015 TaxID=2593644 RepID=UPI0016602CFD|nr:LacI family DNA-binding transcriptional regulator [Nonomuraea sp. SYSU D8015]
MPPNDEVPPQDSAASPDSPERPEPPEPTPGRLRSTDIARLAGVSVSAVSLAFNARPGISDSTRKRILDIAEELNWRPHRAARALKGAGNDVVGIVIARPARTLGVEPFFAHVLSGLQSRMSIEGIATQLLIVEDTEAEVAVYRRWAAENRVDGLVLFDLAVDDVRPQLVADLRIPAVILGGHGAPSPLTSVWADDHAAMTRILDYLSSLGHRFIGHVSGVPSYQHTRRRLRAVADARETLGVDIVTVETDYSDTQGASATRRLLEASPRCTAIIYDSDVMAVAGLGVATEMGVRVPDDVSIVSFDDSVLTRLPHPPITALTRDTYALGTLTATELLHVMAERPEPRAVQAPTPELVPRGSTAPPPERRVP